MLESLGAAFAGFLRQRIELEEARWGAPEAAIAVARRCAEWAHRAEHVALERTARHVEIDALLRAGRPADAAAQADALAAHCAGDWAVYNFYLPEVWLVLVTAWDGAGRRTEADALAHHAAGWIGERAAHDVPAVFRDSFLQRNAINAALLARAGG